MGILLDGSIWANLPVGLILLGLGFGLFTLRIRFIDSRKRKKFVKALCAEIDLIHTVSISDIKRLRRRIKRGKVPFITVSVSHPVFDGHQDQLSLLDERKLTAVISFYTQERLVSEALSRFQDEQFITLSKKRKMRFLHAFQDLNEAVKESRESAIRILSN